MSVIFVQKPITLLVKHVITVIFKVSMVSVCYGLRDVLCLAGLYQWALDGLTGVMG